MSEIKESDKQFLCENCGKRSRFLSAPRSCKNDCGETVSLVFKPLNKICIDVIDESGKSHHCKKVKTQ